jgi:hypothetical protein
MENQPVILHIDLGNQSLSSWLKENKYIIYSELLRYARMMVEQDLDSIQAIMVTNLVDNIVFFLRRENLPVTLGKAMEFFLLQEDYEKCAEIRDLNILIVNKKNERPNPKNNKRNEA